MRKFFRFILIVIAIPVTAFLLLLLYATISNYQPPAKEILLPAVMVKPVLTDSSSVRLLTWNIGYAGLDKSMDFFYDGGKGVRTSRSLVSENMSAIKKFLKSSDSVDIFMLQEVDVNSKRSYGTNEVVEISDTLSDFHPFFAKNYDVFFVPMPFLNPMGHVNSGLLSLSHIKPSLVERMSFPGQYGWPTRLFMLDRCFMVMHFPVTNGKELLVINTHNEAYDDGSIRNQQMAFLKKYLLDEFNKGNYIITGGDWNQCPPGFNPAFKEEVFDSINNKGIESGFMPADWRWIFDNRLPTNRRVDIPYIRGTTSTTLIDFYLLSPNLEYKYVKTTDLRFENSDHQPVQIEIMLSPNK